MKEEKIFISCMLPCLKIVDDRKNKREFPRGLYMKLRANLCKLVNGNSVRKISNIKLLSNASNHYTNLHFHTVNMTEGFSLGLNERITQLFNV